MVKVFSSCPPGRVEARGAKASPSGSNFDSAKSKALSKAAIKIVPCIIQPGPSSATVPLAAKALPSGPDCKITANKARTSEEKVTIKCVNLLFSIETKASTITPIHAAINIIKIGESSAYSKLGVGIELTTVLIILFHHFNSWSRIIYF